METLDDLKNRYAEYSYEQLLILLDKLEGENENLRHLLFGRKSEKFAIAKGQGTLFDEAEISASAIVAPTDKSEDDLIDVKGHKKKRGKRKPLPADLPRERVEHDLSDEQKVCPLHQQKLVKIGEKISEELEIIPASMKVLEHVTFSYKCPCCAEDSGNETIVTSKAEPRLIPGSMASANLIAFIAVSKYQDGLPLYRQEAAFKRVGIDFSRTTLARWLIQASEQTVPLINLMREDQLTRKAIGCDETPVQVLTEPNRLPTQKSYMWVTTTHDGPPIVLFEYYPNRNTKVVADIFDDYEGVIVCDGLKSYDAFAQCSDVRLAGCMAHIRRKFVQAEIAAKKANPKSPCRATEAVLLIKDLYKIEKDIKGQPHELIKETRQEKSMPIMEKFKAWLDREQGRSLPKSLFGKAINYALDQWEKMLVFLTNPSVPIDNNQTEGRIRPFVIGRNNWLFSQSQDGAHASARLYSLIESAKANGIDPFAYLCQIFKELPKAATVQDYERLLPNRIGESYNLKHYQPPK